MVKRTPPRNPENRPERIDWRRVVDGGDAPAPARRAPFRFGGDGGPPEDDGQPGRDPWKELLERGSMQEVLASVRRVSGLPEDPEPQADPPRAKRPPERPVARTPPKEPVAKPPVAKQPVPKQPAAAPGPATTGSGRARPAPVPERTAPKAPSGHEVLARVSPRGEARERPPTDITRDQSPDEAPRPPKEMRRHQPPDEAPPPRDMRRHQPPDEGPRPPAGPATERHGPRAEPDRGPAEPALVLSEIATGDGTDATGGRATPGLSPDLVPRRSALHDVPQRRELGPLGAIALLVVALALGIGFGFAVDADSWNLPWRFGSEQAALEPAAPPDAPAELRSAPVAEATAPAPAEEATAAAPSARGNAIPIPMLRPAGPPEILIEEIGGIRAQGLADDVAPPSAEPAPPGAQTVDGEEVAAAEILRGDVDRLAPLFLGRVFVHYAEASNDPNRRGRALEIARRLEESGYRIGGVRPVSFPITGSSVRYFFKADAPVAARLQEDLPASIADRTRLMDFSAYEPRPRPGTIELWIADPS